MSQLYIGVYTSTSNFYIGLLSAILAATLTGLLTIKFGDRRVIALLLGPLLTLVFARIGYLSVKAFYGSYTRSWVARASKEGGFVPRMESDSVERVLKKAKEKQWRQKKSCRNWSKSVTR
jgi:hypothetical protein